MVILRGKSMADVARDLGINRWTLKNWKNPMNSLSKPTNSAIEPPIQSACYLRLMDGMLQNQGISLLMRYTRPGWVGNSMIWPGVWIRS